VLVVLIAVVEIGALLTRWSHNRRVRDLGDQLFVRDLGAGPPIVLLHGLRGSGRYWGNHFDSLAAKNHLLFVDLLGFGRSPWPQAGYTTEDHLAAIRRSIVSRTDGRRTTLVGHSMGAILALEYARRHRSEVERVIVLGLPMFENETEARERIRYMSEMAAAFSLQPVLARGSCDLLCALRPVLFRAAPMMDRGVPPEVARDSVLHRWESFQGTLRNVILRSRTGDALRELRGTPITIIQGADDPVTDPARLRRVAAESGAMLVIVPGDHNAFLRDPERIVRLVGETLR
jgi:pimeloyl-ACP methyl ester carboxylesterase